MRSLPKSDPRSATWLSLVPRAASVAVVATACLVLAGWTFDSMILRSVLPGQPQMVPNTALTLIVAGAALWLARGAQAQSLARRAAQACALTVAAVGLVTLAEYLTGRNVGVDTLLFHGKLAGVGEAFPGRPSPHTAVNFLLAGSALFLNARGSRAVKFAQALAVAAVFFSLLVLVGYIYRATYLYSIHASTGMALHTALLFVVLSLGVLFTHTRQGLMTVVMSDTAGGRMARRLLPATCALPVVLGGLIVAGERAGAYSIAFALSLCVMANVVALTGLIWWDAKKLYESDTERHRAGEALRKALGDLEARVAERTNDLSRTNAALESEVAERKRAEASRQVLLRRLMTAHEEERRRIARELHDQTSQHLSVLMLALRSLMKQSEGHSPPREGGPTLSLERLRQMQEIIEQLDDQVHRLAWELRPAALDDLGLQTALANYVEKWSALSHVPVDMHSAGLKRWRLAPEVETTIYRLVQEALTNVLKHAGALRVSLILERRRDHTLCVIEDDGGGFDVGSVLGAADPERRLGLLGMQERVALIGGTLAVESKLGAGTTLVARVPASHEEVTVDEYAVHISG